MDEAQLTEQEALRQQLQQEQDLLQQFQEKQEAKLLNQHDREKRLMDEQVENSRRDLEKQVSRCTYLSVQTVTHSLYSLQSKQVCLVQHWGRRNKQTAFKCRPCSALDKHCLVQHVLFVLYLTHAIFLSDIPREH